MTVPRPLTDARLRLLAVAALATAMALGVLLLVPWPASLVLVAWAGLTAVGCLWPGPVLGLLALSVPVQAAGALTAGPVSVTLTKLVLAALVAAFVVRFALGASHIHLTLPVWGYAAVVATLLISILHALELGSWAGEVYRWAIAAVVLVIAQDVVRDRVATWWTVSGIGAGILGASALGFYQVIAEVGPASFQSGGVIRAFATFGEPNPFAAYLELSVPLFLALTLTRLRPGCWRSQSRVLIASGLVSVVGMLALLLTQSRGGVLGFGAAAAVIVWWGGRRLRRFGLIIGLVALIVIGVSPAGQRLGERFAGGGFGLERNVQVTPATWANQERIAHWRAGLAMMEAHPWTGVGAGEFNARYREFTQVWRFRVPRGHAHNGYIQMGAQAGVPGLAAMLFFCGTLLAAARRGLAHAREPADRALALGGFAIAVAFCVHSVFDYLNVLSLGVQLSLVVALATRPLAESFRSLHPAPGSEHPHTGLTA